MSDSKPTIDDVERAGVFSFPGAPTDDDLKDGWSRLAVEFARARAETLTTEREACAKICDALATEAQQKFQPGWLLVTNGHHEAARRIRTRVDA